MSDPDPLPPEDVPLAKVHEDVLPPEEADEAPPEHQDGAVLSYATERFASLVTVATYNTPGEAHLAASMLERAGLTPMVVNEVVSSLGLFSYSYIPVKLQVPAPEADYAARLIARHQKTVAARTRPPCPKCGSTKVAHPYMGPLQIMFSLLLLGIPLFLHGNHWCCLDCGFRWHARPAPEPDDEEDEDEEADRREDGPGEQ